MKDKKGFHLDYEDFGEVPDACPWRSYSVSGHGDTLEDFLDDVTIAEVDQDGGDCACYGFYEGSEAIKAKIMAFVERVLK